MEPFQFMPNLHSSKILPLSAASFPRVIFLIFNFHENNFSPFVLLRVDIGLIWDSHPTAVFFHLFFRSAALLIYLFCSWFSSNFVLNFIVIVLFVSFDFWTVKNVSGRLLVGLRWWNKV